MSEEQNWFKSALALRDMRDGLAPFVSEQTEKIHQRILHELGVDAGTNRICAQCTEDNLLPEHSRQQCIINSRNQCFCRRGFRRKCPNNICSMFYDLILKDHANLSPTWSNTNPTKWCSDYWEYAKCYIISPRYRDVQTAADCDISALLSICITNKRMQLYGHRLASFEQCRVVRNEILHSRSLRVTDKQLSDYIDQMIAVLEDECVRNYIAPVLAVRRLLEIKLQLKRNDFAIIKNESTNVKDEALAETKEISKETVEALNSKTMKILYADRQAGKSLEDDGEEKYDFNVRGTTQPFIEWSEQNLLQPYTTYFLDDEVSLALGDVTSKTSDYLPKKDDGEEKYDSNVRGTTEPFIERLEHILLQPDIRECFDSGFRDFVSRMTTYFLDDEVSLALGDVTSKTSDYLPKKDDGEEKYDSNVRGTTEPFIERLEQILLQPDIRKWFDYGYRDFVSRMTTYIEVSLALGDVTSKTSDYLPKKGLWLTVDDIDTYTGLREKGLLVSTEINKLCLKEGRTSPDLQQECDKICSAIKVKSEQIVHVFPAYKLDAEATVVFVVFAEREITLDLPWSFEVRILHQYSKESKTAMYCVENTPLSNETSRTIGDIIDRHSVELMRNHTYLSAISASSVISKHYGTTSHNIVPEPCIVLTVLVKYFIPITEEPFPKLLEGIPVDVREGSVQFSGGSAADFHDQIRMGCKITSTFHPKKHGTLGGFVEHPEYGLCGVTCAHVILDDKLKLELKEKANVKKNDLNSCEIFQPFYDPVNKIGTLVEVTYKEGGNGKPGVDLALFKIEQRPPTEGNFPEIKSTPSISYESGKVWGKAGIPSNQPRVQKFGFVTELTYGEIQFDNAVVREFPFHSDMKIEIGDTEQKITTTMFKQYHIKSNEASVCFSKLGDSGALVFMKDDLDRENGLRCIGMVVGVLNDNTCAVTPITAILEELKVTQLKPFLPNISWERVNSRIDRQIDSRLREMEERLKDVIKSTITETVKCTFV